VRSIAMYWHEVKYIQHYTSLQSSSWRQLYYYSFSSAGHQFGRHGPLAPSGSATECSLILSLQSSLSSASSQDRSKFFVPTWNFGLYPTHLQ